MSSSEEIQVNDKEPLFATKLGWALLLSYKKDISSISILLEVQESQKTLICVALQSPTIKSPKAPKSKNPKVPESKLQIESSEFKRSNETKKKSCKNREMSDVQLHTGYKGGKWENII